MEFRDVKRHCFVCKGLLVFSALLKVCITSIRALHFHMQEAAWASGLSRREKSQLAGWAHWFSGGRGFGGLDGLQTKCAETQGHLSGRLYIVYSGCYPHLDAIEFCERCMSLCVLCTWSGGKCSNIARSFNESYGRKMIQAYPNGFS